MISLLVQSIIFRRCRGHMHVVHARVPLLLFDWVEVMTDFLVHLEHVDLGLFEDGLHLLVAANLSFIAGILEVVSLDVFP